MIIEDYTPSHHETIDGQPTPAAYEGKFVHIVGPQEEFLVLSPVELTEYHSHIVQRFSRRRADLSSISSPSGEEVRFGTPGWSVKGGGRFRLDRATRTLTLWGSSKAYGRADGAYLREALKTTPGWEGFSVEIGQL